MPIPQLDTEGKIPDGIYDCTLDEIKMRFGTFQRTDHRCRLFDRLLEYVEEVRHIPAIMEVYVNGSFVTAKPEPGDIDLLIVLPEHYERMRTVIPREYNARSSKYVRRRYGFDLLVANKDSPSYYEYRELFHRVKEVPGGRKGYLRLQL